MSLRALLSTSLAVGLLACSAARPIVSGPSDYDAYRRYRLAETLDERLAAGWVYLRDEPEGSFRGEVLRWFGPAEARFFAEAGRTPGGASAYLKLMPDGPHAEEEATFLRAFEREKIEGPLREQRALEAARKKAETARKAAGEAIELWTRRALAITAWREPLESFRKTDKGVADALDETPKATCDAEACAKTLYFTYPVPEASPPSDRVVPVVVRLDLASGAVVSMSIVAPKGGFTWWLEGVEARPIDAFDSSARSEAVMRAKNRIETLTREALGGTCATTEEPTLRTLVCGNVRVTVEATPSGDDVVRVVGLPR